MNKHRTYRVRGKLRCMDGGTVPHPSDVRGEMVRDRLGRARYTRAWCSCCEREVALLKSGILSHHGPNPNRGA